MEMNPEERVEERLRELARTGDKNDPTAAWKREILAIAMTKASRSGRLAPPRPLLIAWAAAWTAILLLSLPQPDAVETDPPLVTAPTHPVSLLFANRSELHRQLNLP
jgi:hypothetical protein